MLHPRATYATAAGIAPISASHCFTWKVEIFEKSLFFQTQLSIRLAQELHQLGSQIDKEEVDRVEALAQVGAAIDELP